MVIVEHVGAFYNLYLSDETGVYYSLSLRDIVVKNAIDLEVVSACVHLRTMYTCMSVLEHMYCVCMVCVHVHGECFRVDECIYVHLHECVLEHSILCVQCVFTCMDMVPFR